MPQAQQIGAPAAAIERAVAISRETSGDVGTQAN